MAIIATTAKPENAAPSTKYGGKIVECQPGMVPAANSSDTSLCTETTSCTASAANSRYAWCQRSQCAAEPRQPSDSTPKKTFQPRLRARSRAEARSGTSPMYQKTIETVRYVNTAQMSHSSGLLNCGHTCMVAG